MDRCTVHRWPRNDYGFQAAVNAAELELQRAVQLRLAQAASAAAAVVASAIEKGDLRASLAVLKGIGALDGNERRPGSDRPEVLEEEAKLAEADRREQNLLQRSLLFELDDG